MDQIEFWRTEIKLEKGERKESGYFGKNLKITWSLSPNEGIMVLEDLNSKVKETGKGRCSCNLRGLKEKRKEW